MPIAFCQFRLPLRTSMRQDGLTIAELMISLSLGLLVILGSTALVVSTKTLFITQTDGNDTQDTARFALDNIARQLRQTGYVNYDFSNPSNVQVTPSTASADLAGMDANSVSATSTDISTPLNTSVNSSDVLAIRFFGSGTGASGDGTMSNCAGFSVPAPMSASKADTDRGWSIYYVSLDANNEPQLMCKYLGNNGNWSAQALVKGVESFQVLYGLDTNTPSDGLSNQYLTASGINALDANLNLTGTTAAQKQQSLYLQTYWKRVLVVKIAILVRGKENSRTDTTSTIYNLFGSDYATVNGANDPGTTINEQSLPASTINRVRKVFTSTIQLRNNCLVDPTRNICLPPNI